MSRGFVILVTVFLMSVAFIFVWTGIIPEGQIKIPHIPDRPKLAPETAVYRAASQVWIDVASANDGNPKHFICTFYGGDSTNNVESAIFELEGKITALSDVRDLLNFYDGYDVYLKDNRIMVMYYY